ncbi:amidoligase family protein [Ruminococcaceae bacterium OttesenSCG-928-D13]|nr:amidoligase family protein [Ruminococcaceae bacterium OttesenSCG-928-D13]
MLTSKFGIEIEFTGITRQQAAAAAAEVLGGTVTHEGGYMGIWQVIAPDRRVWKFVYDGSIAPQRKQGGRKLTAADDYRVEMVSPVLTYERDMETLQNLVRALRKAGGFVNSTAGIHIHLDGAKHTPKSIRNFVNIIASKNDLFYKALQIKPDRMRYCKKMDEFLVKKMNERRPRTLEQIRSIWYEGYGGYTTQHYHDSRYHFLNLHSFFTGHHTVELRGFNSTLHAGLVRSYVVLALALNHQALTQKSASARKPQTENEKFSMRTYLVRIGFKGDAFKNCREHLCKHLSGNAAWRYGQVA